MTLPDAVLAFMLLASCNLSDSQVQLVMSAVPDVTFSKMKSALKRIFHGEVVQSTQICSVPVKQEPVFYGEHCTTEQSLYSRTDNRVRRPWNSGKQRSRGSNRSAGSDARFIRPSYNLPTPTSPFSGRKLNPTNRNSKVSKCAVCGSRFHWARDSQDAYENS